MSVIPDDTKRIVIAGKTGSGKTVEACWQLSQRSFDERPWVAIDFKGRDLLARLPVNRIVTVGESPPNEPGLYYLKASWEDAEPRGAMERYLFRCLQQGRIGLLIDEGQRFGQNNRGLKAVLCEGRSAEVPVIFLTQRPMRVDTFAFSEAEYLQIFNLNHPDDHERIAEWVPSDRLDMHELRAAGRFHSYFYDTETDELELLGPCPPFEEIYTRILVRLPRFEDDPRDAHLPERRERV